MSDTSSSSTEIVANDCETQVGGTSFLDLPFELREMVYDLCIPKKQSWHYTLPFGPKAKVLGINLLRTCRQVRAETHGRVWYRSWTLTLPTSQHSDTSLIDLGLATCSLRDVAKAKIPNLNLFFDIDPERLSSFGLVNLEKLSSFEDLWSLSVTVRWGITETRQSFKPAIDPTNTTFLRGLVLQILLQVPPHINRIYWSFRLWNRYQHDLAETLRLIAKEHKSLQGAHYKPEVSKISEERKIPSVPEISWSVGAVLARLQHTS